MLIAWGGHQRTMSGNAPVMSRASAAQARLQPHEGGRFGRYFKRQQVTERCQCRKCGGTT
jgi:hypothetical protein